MEAAKIDQSVFFVWCSTENLRSFRCSWLDDFFNSFFYHWLFCAVYYSDELIPIVLLPLTGNHR